MLIHNYLEKSAVLYPNKVAVIHDDRRETYGQLNKYSNSLSLHLQESGIAIGDRVVLLIENSIEYIIGYYAVLKAGAVTAPLNPGLKPSGLQLLLNELKPSAIIANHKTEKLLKAVDLNNVGLKSIIICNPKLKWQTIQFDTSTFEDVIKTDGKYSVNNYNKQVDPVNLASIIYTSGSTGRPKGVMLSHYNIVSNTESICESLSITKQDIQMVVLPFFYVMGKSLLNTHFSVGGTVVINNRFMYPADVLKQMVKERVTSFSGVPSTYAYLLNRSSLESCKDKLNDLRYCSQAGGHMATSIKKSLLRTLPQHTQIYIMYGATEASARLTCLPSNYFASKVKSIGKPVSNVIIRVVDENNEDVQDGNEGMLVAQGPNIMMGYWNDAIDTRTVLSENGYITGDIGFRDNEGFLYVTGRKDGLLKVSGHRVNPIEIEDFLLSTGHLIEVVVIGISDELMGNRLVALIVPKNDDININDLLRKCSISLPNHKCPADIVVIRALPKNANGKIDKEQCTKIIYKKLSITK